MPDKKDNKKVLAQNRRARHDYFIEDSWEAGLELKGTEVKSIRMGRCSFKDSYAVLKDGDLVVLGMHISPYEKGSFSNTDPLRPKRLLMHKSEILKASRDVAQKGFSLIPLEVYLKGNLIKLQLGLCRGKKLYDKRDSMAERDVKREMDRAMKR